MSDNENEEQGASGEDLNERFSEVMSGLVEFLTEHMEKMESEAEKKPMREFSRDTLLGDLPDDLTPEESLAIFGTPFDPTIERLLGILKQVAPPGRAEDILAHIPHIVGPVYTSEESETIEEVMPKTIVTDLVTIGFIAHEILSNLVIEPKVVKMSDLLNGKGPFGD